MALQRDLGARDHYSIDQVFIQNGRSITARLLSLERVRVFFNKPLFNRFEYHILFEIPMVPSNAQLTFELLHTNEPLGYIHQPQWLIAYLCERGARFSRSGIQHQLSFFNMNPKDSMIGWFIKHKIFDQFEGIQILTYEIFEKILNLVETSIKKEKWLIKISVRRLFYQVFLRSYCLYPLEKAHTLNRWFLDHLPILSDELRVLKREHPRLNFWYHQQRLRNLRELIISFLYRPDGPIYLILRENFYQSMFGNIKYESKGKSNFPKRDK